MGLTVQNFVTPATGIAVLYALFRGFTRVKGKGVGNFWKDLTRATLYVLIPLSLVCALFIASQGVPQTLKTAESVELTEPVAFDSEGNYLEGAQINGNVVTMNGKVVEDAEVVTEEIVPLGMAASQVAIKQPGGNMEGKEARFGIGSSSTWAVWTTAASNGSVNSMHDSYTPIGGMIPMLLMQLGEVVFGGVGCGLYGMLGFAILTVFIAGLMVGRTPEYLGKKIEPYEMKWAVLVCLATPIAILVFSGIAAAVPAVADSLNNSGAHGFSEMLYAYSSAGGNNGSAFAGFNANTPFLNCTIGVTMLIARFLPITGILAIAGSMVQKKKLAVTAGTLSTSNGMFVFLLIVIVLLIGALSFFPALALGPVAEFLG